MVKVICKPVSSVKIESSPRSFHEIHPNTNFIGRQIELQAISNIIEPAKNGLVPDRQIALVSGLPGIGKTALLEQVEMICGQKEIPCLFFELSKLPTQFAMPQLLDFYGSIIAAMKGFGNTFDTEGMINQLEYLRSEFKTRPEFSGDLQTVPIIKLSAYYFDHAMDSFVYPLSAQFKQALINADKPAVIVLDDIDSDLQQFNKTIAQLVIGQLCFSRQGDMMKNLVLFVASSVKKTDRLPVAFGTNAVQLPLSGLSVKKPDKLSPMTKLIHFQ